MRVPRCALALALTACGVDPEPVAFGFAGRVEDNGQRASTIGLFDRPAMPFFKLGDGTTVPGEFDLVFEREPPASALETGGFGVAVVGLLPGLATLPDGPVERGDVNLIGITTRHAVIFKQPGAAGPDWLERFPEGFSCGQCLIGSGTFEEFERVDCSFVVIQAFGQSTCRWY